MRLHYAKKMRRRRGAPRIPYTVDQLAAKLRYWGDRCWICHASAEAVDHVKPLSKGGWWMLANLRPICNYCNGRKHNRWPFPCLPAVAREWMHATPLSWPAQRRARSN
jgi:hypothetical protein